MSFSHIFDSTEHLYGQLNFIASNGTGDGKSAYELACENGFTGTIAEWLDTLDGKSAYEVACENGFTGTIAEWLDTLDGKSAYELACDNDFIGTSEEWIVSLNGKSAYEVACLDSFSGSQSEWLASLIGKSAYELACQNGFVGSLDDWLASLNGSSGTGGSSSSAYESALLHGFVGTEQEFYLSLVSIPQKVDKMDGKTLSSNDFTTEYQDKLLSLNNYDDSQLLITLNSKANISNVFTKTECMNYFEDKNSSIVKDSAYVHTDNNFTSAEKTKLASLSANSGNADTVDDLHVDDAKSALSTATNALWSAMKIKSYVVAEIDIAIGTIEAQLGSVAQALNAINRTVI